MTPEQRKALEALVPEDQRTGDEATDLLVAVREGRRRCVTTPAEIGVVLVAMHELDPKRWSWRGIERDTGIPQRSARRLAERAAEEQ